MKAILVMEMPENCIKCPLLNGSDECIVQDEETNYYADTFYDLRNGCPLVPMPERANHPDYCDNGRFDAGWNACLDAIERSKR